MRSRRREWEEKDGEDEDPYTRDQGDPKIEKKMKILRVLGLLSFFPFSCAKMRERMCMFVCLLWVECAFVSAEQGSKMGSTM